jgi:hypothetical protein
VADHSLPDAAGLTFGGIDVGRTLQMPDISIQFHAIPDEMRDFAEEIVHDFSLHMVAMKFFPFEAVEVKPNDIARVFSDESPYREFMFTVTDPVVEGTGNMKILDENPGALRLTIERKTKEGLGQSGLDVRTDDPALLPIWRAVARRLKGMTKAGVTIVNPITGDRGWYRTFRYSSGAKAWADSGIPILGLGGFHRLDFSGSPPIKSLHT